MLNAAAQCLPLSMGLWALCFVRWRKKTRAEGPARAAKKMETTGDEQLRRAGGRTPRGGNHRHGLHGLRDLRTDRGTRHVARLGEEALLERLVDPLFDGDRLLANHLGDFRNNQRLGTIEHSLLA